jgi:hypothetical protein
MAQACSYYYDEDNDTYIEFDENGRFIPNEYVMAFYKGPGFDDSLIKPLYADYPVQSKTLGVYTTAATSAEDYYAQALAAANRAQKRSVEQGVSQLKKQKNTVNQSYDDIAKQVYANYRQGQIQLPMQTSGLASGAADSLSLRGRLNYENALQSNERQRADALDAIDTLIAELRANGAQALAENIEKYALLTAQSTGR